MNIVAVGKIPEAEAVPTEGVADVFKVCKQMEVICDQHNGIGLSAVQIGIGWKLFIVKFEGHGYRYFIDCEYEPLTEDKKKHVEGCLSLPGESYVVSRWEKVKVTGQELVVEDSEPKLVAYESELNGLAAIVFQHEADHARGVLIRDIGEEVSLQPV